MVQHSEILYTMSEAFSVSNGVEHDRILSPILFNVFINELSVALNNEFIGYATCQSLDLC